MPNDLSDCILLASHVRSPLRLFEPNGKYSYARDIEKYGGKKRVWCEPSDEEPQGTYKREYCNAIEECCPAKNRGWPMVCRQPSPRERAQGEQEADRGREKPFDDRKPEERLQECAPWCAGEYAPPLIECEVNQESKKTRARNKAEYEERGWLRRLDNPVA